VVHGRRSADRAAFGPGIVNPGSGPSDGGGIGGPIWLVRHAATAWTGVRWCGRSDPALTPAGLSAAQALAAELASELASAPGGGRATDAVILASPLRRALETADAIGLTIGTRVRVEPDLAEIDFGAVDGLTWDELVAAHPGFSDLILAGADVDWPGGETAVDVARRAGSDANRILAIAAAGPVIAVSHGGLLREIARRLLPVEPGADSPFEPSSARRLDLVDGRWVAAVAESSVVTG
jgi:ribonuclease H / adenosylcobalamin/alpha-ribazole phosphatase